MQLPDIPLFIPLGPYRMINRIGQGARGVVYQAEETGSGRMVAVKFLALADDVGEAESRTRFEREAQVLSQFDHPHIVHYEASGTLHWRNHDLPYYAMEFLFGLRCLTPEVAEENGPDWFLDRIEELLTALDYMHGHPQGIVHRDLKPANLGIPQDDRLKVLDLGLARVQTSQLTGTGTFMGSMGYISPEQIMDAKEVDSRTDLYAVGMIVLEGLGGHPFRSMTSGRAVKAIVTGKIPSTPRPLPPGLEHFARRLCAHKREARPATAGQALQELREVRSRL